MHFSFNTILLLFSVLFSLFSCREVTIRVTEIPPNTPPGSRLYVMGNFNYWDPGDPSYQLKMDEDSNYSISIPRGFGTIEYKISRGELSSIETDICGYHMNNRVIKENEKAVIAEIKSWKDVEPLLCGHITFKLEVPENTPQDEPLTLAGNYNLWNPGDSSSYFTKDSGTGEYLLTIPKPKNTELLSVKVTRGDLSKSEADVYGNEAPIRNIAYSPGDTIKLKVDSWEDMVKPVNNNVTIVINSIPENTPPFADIYIAGDFNGWYPRDKNFLMKNFNGKYYFSLPRKGDKIEFKFTRGSWKTEEVDKNGNTKNNYVHEFSDIDTIRFTIDGWKDLYNTQRSKYITFEVVKLPENTPNSDDLYITGSFNNWNPGEFQYRLKPNSKGNLSVSIPRKSRTVEYKFTRGKWETEEVDLYGRKIKNRFFKFDGEEKVEVRIENWLDLYRKNYKAIRVVIDEYPENTPPGADIYFASNLNDWDPRASRFRLKMSPDGKYYIDLPVYKGTAYFKFTRGNWQTVEANSKGDDIDNRALDFSGRAEQHFKIESWLDLPVQ